tara:strand:+ start:1281 stop:1415 length:135 start_codon:yes stop_codon:yes gene_type:complete
MSLWKKITAFFSTTEAPVVVKKQMKLSLKQRIAVSKAKQAKKAK